MMSLFLFISYYLGIMLFAGGVSGLSLSVDYFFHGKIMFIEWEIYEFNSSSIIMTLLFDWMSLSFMSLVMIISSMVLFYSNTYMSGEKHIVRFILLVYLFVLSMVFLILSPNLISILLGWDGLGLVSYCLVIYYQNVKSSNAGMITVLSNRIGDVAILLGISWLLNFGSWNFFYLQFLMDSMETKILGVLIILAAMTKSAQMPFSAWLPAAMAAPTPVSALVHSSTLVTAGVYLLIRFNYMLGLSNFLFFIGVLTMFMSGLGANYETDLKKIIALSTLSQLGLMMMTIGLGYVEFSFFHLLTHAMFKSLLFLCAGVFIHSMGDTQDIRMMGGLLVSCPSTSFYFIGSSMALCGAPFLSGFYSKDLILELFFTGEMNIFMFMIIFLATLFTLSYTVRLMFFVFYSNYGVRSMLNLEEDASMVAPMTLLFMLSIFAGGVMSVSYFPVCFIFLPLLIKTSVMVSLAFLFSGLLFLLMEKIVSLPKMTSKLIFYLGSMWFLPLLSSVLFMPVFKSGEGLAKSVDQGWLEYIGGKGFMGVASRMGTGLDVSNLVGMKFYVFTFMMLILFIVFI